MSKKNLFDELMEAVTFAEAGETGTAREIAAELFPDGPSRSGGQILAVSRGAGFSRRMIEKSLGIAERLDCGLVALSVPPAMRKLVAILGGRKAEPDWCSPEVFRARAAELGIPFIHAHQPGDPEKVVAELSRRIRRISFLLIEPDQLPRARFSAVNVPIFSVTDD